MENINSLSNYTDDYISSIQNMIRSNASINASAATLKAGEDILDTLLDGTFQFDSEVPEGSTFSLHV